MVAEKCLRHPDLGAERAMVLRDRLFWLERWPRDLGDALTDLRCGCAEDGEGSICEWDSIESIETELQKRE